MATDGGPKQRRPRKPPVVREREREREEDELAPDSESPERLRSSAWRWFKKDELAAKQEAAQAAAEAVATKAAERAAVKAAKAAAAKAVEQAPETEAKAAEVVPAEPNVDALPSNEGIVDAPTISVVDALEPLGDVVPQAPPENVVAPEGVAEDTKAVEPEAQAPEPEAPTSATVVEVSSDAPAEAAPSEGVKRKRGPRKKPAPEPIGWFRSRAAAWFRARRSASPTASVAVEAQMSVVVEDATKTSGSVARAHLKGVLEALIFASEHPLSSRDLARTAKAEHRVVTSLLAELMDEYRGRGVRLDEVAGGYVFRTSPAFAPFVREHVAKKPVKMTRAQVETLAIIAYKQPITRPEIDDVRGVDSGAILKSLLERELVRILGKKEEAGRPLLYGTTPQFLEFFGLKALGDLPTLREFTELTDESKRIYEREMGEEPLDTAVVLTNADNLGTSAGVDGFGMTSGGLMGGEGDFRAPGQADKLSPNSEQDAVDALNDGQEIDDVEQGEEARMKNEEASEIDDLDKRTSGPVDDEEDEDDEDDEDEEDDEDDDDDDEDDEDDEDEDEDDEDEDEDDEDEDDE